MTNEELTAAGGTVNLDELMPLAIRNGVAAALVTAEREGLIKFPQGSFRIEEMEHRIDLIIAAFIKAVQMIDPIQLKD